MIFGHPCPVKLPLLAIGALVWAFDPGHAIGATARSASTSAPANSASPASKNKLPARSPAPAPSDPEPGASPTPRPVPNAEPDPSEPPTAEGTEPTSSAPGTASPESSPPSDPTTVPDPGAAAQTVPEPTTDSEVSVPGPSDEIPATPSESATEPTLDPALLGGSTERDASPRVAAPPPPVEDSLADPGLHQESRLPGNPTRFQLTARALFSSVGANKLGGGRLGGTRVDVGQTWNVMGYALSLTALGGQVQLEQGEDIVALLGGGPSLTLGRFAMIGRGVADLRLGYDFFYAPGRGGTWAPHGPRVSLDMALLTSGRRFWQGFGVSIGYQALVHSFADDMPYAGMLTAGVLYWFG